MIIDNIEAFLRAGMIKRQTQRLPSFNLWFLARMSLVVLWLLTALTSLSWGKSIGMQLLLSAGFSSTSSEVLIVAGSVLDAFLACWLFSGRALSLCYLLQISTIVIYSILLSLIDPSSWLHPFGPISKNLPILMLILLLWQHQKHTDALR